MRRRTALLLSSVVALSCPVTSWAGGVQPRRPMISVNTLSSIRLGINTVDTQPINGFIPQMVIGLTNETGTSSQDNGVEGFGVANNTPGGSMLPVTGGSPYYAVATLDS